MEKYIEQSATIGIFLSKCYFQSRNCLREVVGTLDQRKPYLFVHEADPAKGGGPLEELKLELENEKHRNALFDGRRVTVWHRIADFQLVSLLQIAEDMLLFSPEYEGREALPLYVPGGLLEQRLAFPKPVELYVSKNNPGADVLAKEVISCFDQISITSTFPLSSEAPAGSSTTQATHFLLYLNKQTFNGPEGETLAVQVRDTQRVGMQIVMVHENDPDQGSCEFANFFQTTPPDLIQAGLYKALAIPFMSGKSHRKVSHALFAKELGATRSEGGIPHLAACHDAMMQDTCEAPWHVAQTAVGAAGSVGTVVSGAVGRGLQLKLPKSSSRPRITFSDC